MTLNEKIQELEDKILALETKIQDLSQNTEEKTKSPYSIAGGNKSSTTNMPIDAKTGLGGILANHVIWNDSEGFIPPLNAEPDLPTKGYNKHSHSRFSGGALIKDKLEIVEYVWGSIVNKESQQFWVRQPAIKTQVNSKGQTVQKIGNLDLVFNPDTLMWGVTALEIDIKKCNLVERDDDGNIIHSAPLWNEDPTKTSILWDITGECWRLLAVYAEGN